MSTARRFTVGPIPPADTALAKVLSTSTTEFATQQRRFSEGALVREAVTLRRTYNHEEATT
jgi:hypothetical protein